MKLASLLVCATVFTSATNAVSIPASAKALSIRSIDAVSDSLNPFLGNALEKRKGGGGKSGGGGSSSSGGASSGGRSSGPTTQSNSNAGGRTATGSGVTPNYGGGKYYGGGATAPYSAGGRSPLGLAPLALIPLAGLAIFPGLWLYSAYAYPYSHPYSFRNDSANANQTKPVQCYCQQYSVCGCDDNTDPTYMNGIIGNGSYQGLNRTLANVADVNGTSTILINGTLPNGTTASGGTDSAAPSLRIAELGGWWIAGAIVLYSVMLL